MFIVSPIPESVSPLRSNGDPVSAMCQQLSLGLSLLSKVDEHTMVSNRSQYGTQSYVAGPLTIVR